MNTEKAEIFRRHTRVKIQLPVTIVTKNYQTIDTESLDISEGGLKASITKKEKSLFSLGDILKVHISGLLESKENANVADNMFAMEVVSLTNELVSLTFLKN